MIIFLLFANAFVAFQLMWRRSERLFEASKSDDVLRFRADRGSLAPPQHARTKLGPFTVQESKRFSREGLRELWPDLYRSWKIAWIYVGISFAALFGYAFLTDV